MLLAGATAYGLDEEYIGCSDVIDGWLASHVSVVCELHLVEQSRLSPRHNKRTWILEKPV